MQLPERQVELFQSRLSREQARARRELRRSQWSVRLRHRRRLRVHRRRLVLQLTARLAHVPWANTLLGGRLGVPLAGLPSK